MKFTEVFLTGCITTIGLIGIFLPLASSYYGGAVECTGREEICRQHGASCEPRTIGKNEKEKIWCVCPNGHHIREDYRCGTRKPVLCDYAEKFCGFYGALCQKIVHNLTYGIWCFCPDGHEINSDLVCENRLDIRFCNKKKYLSCKKKDLFCEKNRHGPEIGWHCFCPYGQGFVESDQGYICKMRANYGEECQERPGCKTIAATCIKDFFQGKTICKCMDDEWRDQTTDSCRPKTDYGKPCIRNGTCKTNDAMCLSNGQNPADYTCKCHPNRHYNERYDACLEQSLKKDIPYRI